MVVEDSLLPLVLLRENLQVGFLVEYLFVHLFETEFLVGFALVLVLGRTVGLVHLADRHDGEHKVLLEISEG
jgi:hypothetical protein